jgi:hypothetical protein
VKPYHLSLEPGPPGVDGVATYDRREHSLWYATEAERIPSISLKGGHPTARGVVVREESVFLIADTLTLRFNGERILVALDAYTNAALWERVEASEVVPVARGRLRVEWGADGDRVSLPGAVRYTVTSDLRQLHIHFDEYADAPVGYAEVGAGLLVCLERGTLREIVVTDLGFNGQESSLSR